MLKISKNRIPQKIYKLVISSGDANVMINPMLINMSIFGRIASNGRVLQKMS